MSPRFPAGRNPGTGPNRADTTIPVLAEELELARQREETGALRVRVEVDRQHETLTDDALVERVSVTRVPRDVAVPAAQAPWTEGETLVVPVYEERIVVERRLVLKEEIRITRHAQRTPVEAQALVRRERAVVERQQPDGSWREVGVNEEDRPARDRPDDAAAPSQQEPITAGPPASPDP
jgi:uncharacterized protein (TIGR02271 family)